MKEFTHSHTMTPLDAPGKQAFKKTLWEQEKMLVTSIIFSLFGKLSAIFIEFKIVACKHFQFKKTKICRLGKS